MNNRLTEKFWGSIKYMLFFLISMLGLYVVLVKYLIRIPESNIELLETISRSEEILEKEVESAERLETIALQIKKEVDYKIYNVQQIYEIQKDINHLGELYRRENNNSRFTFAIISGNVLQILLNTKKESSSLDRNQKLIENNLKECRANISI